MDPYFYIINKHDAAEVTVRWPPNTPCVGPRGYPRQTATVLSPQNAGPNTSK